MLAAPVNRPAQPGLTPASYKLAPQEEATETIMPSSNGQQVGEIVQVIGSTFDAEFAEGHLPDIYNALTSNSDYKGVQINLVGEVQQHLGGSRVRCVALGSTDGLVRGMQVQDTGAPVAVPVGKEV